MIDRTSKIVGRTNWEVEGRPGYLQVRLENGQTLFFHAQHLDTVEGIRNILRRLRTLGQPSPANIINRYIAFYSLFMAGMSFGPHGMEYPQARRDAIVNAIYSLADRDLEAAEALQKHVAVSLAKGDASLDAEKTAFLALAALPRCNAMWKASLSAEQTKDTASPTQPAKVLRRPNVVEQARYAGLGRAIGTISSYSGESIVIDDEALGRQIRKLGARLQAMRNSLSAPPQDIRDFIVGNCGGYHHLEGLITLDNGDSVKWWTGEWNDGWLYGIKFTTAAGRQVEFRLPQVDLTLDDAVVRAPQSRSVDQHKRTPGDLADIYELEAILQRTMASARAQQEVSFATLVEIQTLIDLTVAREVMCREAVNCENALSSLTFRV